MEPWPSLIFMLRVHSGLFVLNFHFFHCSTSSRASKGPLRCRRWTFGASPITCQYVGYADIRQPLRATVRTHMFYPRPLQQAVPQYVGLDVHLICMRFRPARWCKKLRSCAAPLCFHPKLPAKLANHCWPQLHCSGIVTPRAVCATRFTAKWSKLRTWRSWMGSNSFWTASSTSWTSSRPGPPRQA